MRLVFHGSAKEVGRSCIELCFDVSGKERRFLLDAGFKIHGNEPLLPTTVSNISDIDGVFVTHAHMDHIGALPYFHHYGMSAPLFMTGMTRNLSKIMLEDSFHLELLRHHHPAYTNIDLNEVLRESQKINYYHLMKYKDIEFEFIPSGHIPGSSMILFQLEGKTLLYSGDIQTDDSHLIHGVNFDFLKRHNVDLLILESTYGNRERKNRAIEEKKFLDEIELTLNKGGSVLLPSFAIGRAQEIIMMVTQRNFNVPIYLDGMAKKVADVLVAKELHIRNSDILKESLSKVRYVRNPKERAKVLHEQCIIVTTSGMVSGGPVIEYLKHFWHTENDAILLSGFQAQGTNGRMLLEDGGCYIDGHFINFRSKIKKYDFSGHAGKKGLLNFVKKVSPKVLVINHGDSEALKSLAESSKKYVEDIHIPELGSTIMF